MNPPAKNASLWPAIALGWALACLVLVAAGWGDIARLKFPDPDDPMRLLQVRDWLAGQSWWDVSQHRLAAGAMHWSRLVDLPIAGVILAMRPLLGQAGAELAALIAVPLITLLAVLALAAHLTRRLAGPDLGRLAVLIVPLSVPILYQTRPLRVDHHGWQIVLALAALVLLAGKPTIRAGALIGLSLAALVTISLEGLPIAAALCGIAALAWAFQPGRRASLLATVWSLFASLLLLQLATRGPGYAAPLCDAITPDWIAAMGIAALASFTGRAPLPVRIGALAVAGAAAIGWLVFRAPACVAGPFAQLDPLTRSLWYENVSEGLPFWRQYPSWAIMTMGLPIVGIVGAVLAIRASEGEARTRWILLLAALIPATLLAALVMRAGATANAIAVPSVAWALGAMLARARAIPSIPLRTVATAAALLIASPGLTALAILGSPQTQAMHAPRGDQAARGRPACTDGTQIRAVGQLPSGMIFAPVDVAPDILVATHHRAVASGHHRNMAAMHDVFAAFTGTPETAHRLIVARGAQYVAVCPGLNEPEIYREAAPNGFWARLERGERFPWLEPVPISGSPVLVWKLR
ncbi:hypothetical protein [Sphingomonas sp. dw_22]|uniref:hypothetical protein n=1 Tax=Sphingomonas sp. dw_22 TaxID=2721175 RepID=UPI001BD4578E|nr:hypothetical protein [Sphingomonas sp. dw_22]